MSASDVVGLVAVIVFAVLVALLAVPILKLGKAFDEIGTSVRQLTEETVPLLKESATIVASANSQVERVDTITRSAAEVTQNVSALTALFAATVGSPLIKVAAFTYGVRTTLASKRRRRRGQADD